MSSSAAQLPSLEPLMHPERSAASSRVVLLVEDEDALAELLTHLLGRLSIGVIRAPDGASALRLFAQHQATIVLAFVDCRLPDMDGADVCHALRRTRPNLPLLLTSGRDHRALLATFSAAGPAAFLAKPYMPGDVMRHVTALLNATA